ncbi:MAG: hypothetical protein ACON38_16960 [Akkermansiaceae bacterium]
MNTRIVLVALGAVFVSCSPNTFPDPYAGFEHVSSEQGYWKELTSGEEQIRELHLHSKGFSVTFQPFETYKDYWGPYALGDDRRSIKLDVDGGNDLPAFEEGSGRFVEKGNQEIRIDGIVLDKRRPFQKSFRFQRFEPVPRE